MGGIYSVLSLYFVSFNFLLQIFIHIAVLIIICSIATPATDSNTVIKTTAVFFVINAASGGIISGIFSLRGKYVLRGTVIYADISPVELCLIILFIIAVSIPFFIKTGKRISIKTATISISFHGNSTELDALIDSGNLLSDPISGDGIILIKEHELKKIFSNNELLAIKSLDVLSESFPTGIRLISSDNGLIPVFRPKLTEVKIFGRKESKKISVLVGIDFSSGTFGGTYGLIPAQYIF